MPEPEPVRTRPKVLAGILVREAEQSGSSPAVDCVIAALLAINETRGSGKF
jgi:hypothetical protein